MKQVIAQIRDLSIQETETIECMIWENVEDRTKKLPYHWIVLKAREFSLMEAEVLMFWYRKVFVEEELVLLFRELEVLLMLAKACDYQRISKPEFKALWDHFERKFEQRLLEINEKK